MVLVNLFFSISSFVLISFISLRIIVTFINKISLTNLSYLVFTNIFLLNLILSTLPTSWPLALILLVVFAIARTINWPAVLTAYMENSLTTLPFPLRFKVLAELLRENSTITLSTFPKYFFSIIKGECEGFISVFKTNVNDMKVAFGLKEPAEEISQDQWDWYYFQKKYFMYRKVEEPKVFTIKDDEELLKLYNFWKKARDPRVKFNLVSRLPIYLKNDISESIYFKNITKHFILFYNFFKTTIIALLLTVVYFLYTLFFFKVQFLKQLAVWFVIGMLFFWLMSGFNFFLKRYQFGKFTSQIQRFWKRTNTSFWLIEGFLILLFFYYFLNSSQEPLYMYDYSALNQEYLVSLHTIFINVVLLSLVIYFMYFTMLRINSNSWQQLNLYLILISVFIFFSFFIETYQFYYVISTFNERLWLFNEEENLWAVDIENPILRAKQNYLLVCLIAKYWHFLFIFLSWVFFLIKSFEKKKITIVLFGANLQNVMILYLLNFACYIQWFKWLYRRFFDLPYTWFMTNIDNRLVNRLFFEIKLVFENLFHFNASTNSYKVLTHKSLTLWNVDSLALWKFL